VPHSDITLQLLNKFSFLIIKSNSPYSTENTKLYFSKYAMQTMTVRDALNSALDEEMQVDRRLVVTYEHVRSSNNVI